MYVQCNINLDSVFFMFENVNITEGVRFMLSFVSDSHFFLFFIR